MPIALPTLIYALAFVAVALLAHSVASLVFASGDRTRAVNRRLSMLDAGQSREQVYAKLVRHNTRPGLSLGRLGGLYEAAELYCGQAGLSLSPARLFGLAMLGAVALWLLAMMVSGGGGGSLLLNGSMSMVGAVGLSSLAVFHWVRRKRLRRINALEQQLPLALDIINRAIRAGHPVIAAVQLASEELGDPLGSEFGLVVDETNYGVEFKEALTNFARRTGSSDGHFFAVSVSIQSETGGNLAEILQGLANVMRGRNTLAKRVKALSSEGRASAVLLSVLPILMILFQLVIHPRVYSDKFSDPIFWPAVGVTGLVYLMGWLMIHRIINFKY